MKLILAIIYVILLAPLQQPAGCVVSSGTNIPADLATAEAGSRCLEIPAGTYAISPAGGEWLNVTADGMEIRGSGIGKTIIQTQGVTLTASLYLIQLHGKNQHVHDLTIQIGTGYSGSSEVGGVRAYVEAEHSLIERVEVSGGYSGNGSNGFGIGTSRLFSTNQAAQYVTIRDCYVHDSPTTGIGINSSNNLILHNHIKNVGTSSLQHGLYAQGGDNIYDGNIVENVSGYAYHGWKKVPSLDGSGDRVVNNTFRGYGGAVIVSGMPNAANPSLPIGANLTRDVTIAHNRFIGPGLVNVGVPALISGNVLEGARIEVAAGGDGSRVLGNQIGGFTLQGLPAIKIDAPALIQANTIDMNGYTTGMAINGNASQIRDNRITRTAAGTADWMIAINLNANDLDVSGNYISLNGAQLLGVGTAPAGLRLHDNVLLTTRFVMRDGVRVVSGVMYDNRMVGTLQSGVLVLRDND